MNNPMLPPPFSFSQCLERMGPSGRGRYEDLKALVSDATALERTAQERITAVQEEFGRLQRRYGRAVQTGDADAAKRLEADLAAVGAKADKLERERSRRNSVAANTGQVVSRLTSFIEAWWMGSLSNIVEPPRIAVTPRLLDGETAIDAVMRLRSEINQTRGELAKVQAAPLPANEVRAALIDAVDRMAEQGRPRIAIEGTRATVTWPDQQEFAAPGQALAAPSGGASKLMAWLHRDQIITQLTATLVDVVPGAIPAAERPGRIRELEENLFALEVQEEYFVGEAIAAGLECHRRVDASPWAILGWGLAREEALSEAAE